MSGPGIPALRGGVDVNSARWFPRTEPLTDRICKLLEGGSDD
jgi:hypothetical protein